MSDSNVPEPEEVPQDISTRLDEMRQNTRRKMRMYVILVFILGIVSGVAGIFLYREAKKHYEEPYKTCRGEKCVVQECSVEDTILDDSYDNIVIEGFILTVENGTQEYSTKIDEISSVDYYNEKVVKYAKLDKTECYSDENISAIWIEENVEYTEPDNSVSHGLAFIFSILFTTCIFGFASCFAWIIVDVGLFGSDH